MTTVLLPPTLQDRLPVAVFEDLARTTQRVALYRQAIRDHGDIIAGLVSNIGDCLTYNIELTSYEVVLSVQVDRLGRTMDRYEAVRAAFLVLVDTVRTLTDDATADALIAHVLEGA